MALGLLSLLGCSGLAAQSEPIRMVLSCQSTRSLTVRFENVGTEDTAIVVGITLANGRRYIMDGLTLQVKGDQSSGVESWRISHHYSPNVAGRMDDWIVPLPIGGAFDLKLDASQLWSEQFNRLEGFPLNARVSLRLPLRAPNPGMDVRGLGLLRVWTGNGVLASNEISIAEQCR
jgi:hypothetical protein